MAVTRWNPSGVAAPAGAYSMVAQATAGAIIVQLAGQVGVDGRGELAVGAEEQALAAYANVASLLAELDATPADLLHLRSYVVGRDSLEGFRAARLATYARWFPSGEAPPTHTLLVVAGLSGPDMLVEIEGVVALG